MTSTAITDERRQTRAAAALTALGPNRADHHVLLVECRRGHALGAVYETDLGPVFVSHPRPNAFDERDLAGQQHHRTSTRHEFIDMLHATWADDDLPADCYCGSHTLSRSDLEADLQTGRRLITVG